MAHDLLITDRSIASTASTFLKSLPDGAQQSSDNDKTLIAKTSPTVWEYEMFRIEWNRRSMLRALYELERDDPRVQRSNQIYGSTAVRRGFDLRITSDVSQKEAEKAQDVINDFLRRVQMNGKLEPWTWVLLRDGDLFLNPVVNPASRLITQIKSLPAITMQRNDDITGNFPDLDSSFQQIDPLSLQPLLELPLWQINHIRWHHEDGERYGRSQYISCISTWRKLHMSEQDLVIRRRTRAAPKRVHIIGSQDRPGNDREIRDYMERNKLDGSTRDIVTDYFINGLGDVKDLNADAQLDHIADIEYLQEVHMLGTGVPLPLLGFGQNVNRDVLEEQKAQFDEDVERLRRIIEYGDGSAYSGIRALVDFQLALQEIDPTILDYNIVWFENDNETANDRVKRVTDLRAATPDPLLSRKTSLRILAKDLGLDTNEAIDKEIEQIKEEQAEAVQEKQAEMAQLNPPNGSGPPAPATDATESQGVSMNLRNIDMHGTGNNISFPLHSDPRLLELEKQVRSHIKGLFGTMAQRYVAQNQKHIAKLADFEPSQTTGALDWTYLRDDADTGTHRKAQVAALVAPLLFAFMQDDESFVQPLRDLIRSLYMDVGEVARSNIVATDPQLAASAALGYSPLAFKVVDASVRKMLQQTADDRVTEILNTTHKMLEQALTESSENQETAQQLTDRVKGILDMPDWRVEMIAGSELANAYNENVKEAYRELGVHEVRWVARMDGKTCVRCASKHGQVYTLNNLPDLPAHPRCRCTVIDARLPMPS